MRNIMTRILNFILNFKLLKYLLKRPSWSSNVRIIEWYKIFIASIWVLYLALEIEQFKRFASPIYKFVSNYNRLKDIILILYENRVIILLVLTIPTILDIIFKKVSYKKVSYKKLDPELFPEYDLDDYPFQTHLVEFLNSPDSIHNVYWLDGSWGSGKTFFIKTFFENQIYKKKEIYYISCFGIKTREQVEKILINEIEKQSILGNLDFIPLVGGVFKWFFKIVGTDLMKRDSIIIFDDFERVSYVAKSDNPSDYNDLLGYIDYLSENKKFKIIVILNIEEIGSAKKIIYNKFKLNHNRMVSTEEVIDNILKKSKLRDDDFGKMLSLIFKIYYVDKNYREVQEKNQQMKEEKLSLREFQKSLEELSNKTDESEKANYIIEWMNGWGGTENILVSLFEYLDKDEIYKHFEHLYERKSYLYFEMLSIILNYDIPGIMSDYPLVSINQKTMYSMFDVKKKYFFELLSFLWKKGLKNLFISKTGDKITVDDPGIPDIEEKKYLVEIYYGLQNGYINIKTQKDKLNELLKNEKYRDFVQNYLRFKI